MGVAEDLTEDVNRILSTAWSLREGRKVPDDAEVALDGGGVELEAAFLYADMSDSSGLVTRFTKNVAGKIMRAYLSAMSRLVLLNEGIVTNLDGDRVMAVFVGPGRASQAALTALQMNWALEKVIRPRGEREFPVLGQNGYKISHAVGVDVGSIRAVRAGRRNANDLVWIGRAPAFAAKLSDHEGHYMAYLSEETYSILPKQLQINGDPPRSMWENTELNFVGQKLRVYGSNWYWSP